MKRNDEELLHAIETVVRMDKSSMKRLDWDPFHQYVLIYNRMGTLVKKLYIGTATPAEIMLLVAAEAVRMKGGVS